MLDRPRGMLSLEELAALASSGQIDTVVTGFTDHEQQTAAALASLDAPTDERAIAEWIMSFVWERAAGRS